MWEENLVKKEKEKKKNSIRIFASPFERKAARTRSDAATQSAHVITAIIDADRNHDAQRYTRTYTHVHLISLRSRAHSLPLWSAYGDEVVEEGEEGGGKGTGGEGRRLRNIGYVLAKGGNEGCCVVKREEKEKENDR